MCPPREYCFSYDCLFANNCISNRGVGQWFEIVLQVHMVFWKYSNLKKAKNLHIFQKNRQQLLFMSTGVGKRMIDRKREQKVNCWVEVVSRMRYKHVGIDRYLCVMFLGLFMIAIAIIIGYGRPNANNVCLIDDNCLSLSALSRQRNKWFQLLPH
jgi:hypothetical protein